MLFRNLMAFADDKLNELVEFSTTAELKQKLDIADDVELSIYSYDTNRDDRFPDWKETWIVYSESAFKGYPDRFPIGFCNGYTI